MAQNWMEKYEQHNDEKFEREINNRLETLLDLLDRTVDQNARVNILEGIIEEYEDLRRNIFDYDEKDYEAKKKELKETIDRIKYEEHNSSKEAESWNEFRDEEEGMER